eukprot:scaffold67727_cov66-Phaeocystis_antarctica.AAC.2
MAQLVGHPLSSTSPRLVGADGVVDLRGKQPCALREALSRHGVGLHYMQRARVCRLAREVSRWGGARWQERAVDPAWLGLVQDQRDGAQRLELQRRGGAWLSVLDDQIRQRHARHAALLLRRPPRRAGSRPSRGLQRARQSRDQQRRRDQAQRGHPHAWLKLLFMDQVWLMERGRVQCNTRQRHDFFATVCVAPSRLQVWVARTQDSDSLH